MRIAVITGAGMSAESGIPTFRNTTTGLWAHFDPQKLATPEGFRRDPSLVWGWYRQRAAQLLQTQPHSGHIGLTQIATTLGHQVDIITQNVDDLHERAKPTIDTPPQIIHLHGSLLSSRCIQCGYQANPDPICEELASLHIIAPNQITRERPPLCPLCRGLFRPDVVWFGEMLPQAPWQQAQQIITTCQLVVVIGTSGSVYPAASLLDNAHTLNKPIIEINPEANDISQYATQSWQLSASQGVERLLNILKQQDLTQLGC